MSVASVYSVVSGRTAHSRILSFISPSHFLYILCFKMMFVQLDVILTSIQLNRIEFQNIVDLTFTSEIFKVSKN